MDTMSSMYSDEEFKIRAIYLFLSMTNSSLEKQAGALMIDELKKNDLHNCTYQGCIDWKKKRFL